MEYLTRVATTGDIPTITEIYNQGITDRTATLETKIRTVQEMGKWFISRSDRHKVVVIEDINGNVLGWASLNVFNPRLCYSGVADLSIYIKREMRGKGLGKILLGYLIKIAKEQDFYKLVLHVFNINERAKRLYVSLGFREVGTYIKHGFLDGKWIDITIMEKLL